jgi:hypothetical protein
VPFICNGAFNAGPYWANHKVGNQQLQTIELEILSERRTRSVFQITNHGNEKFTKADFFNSQVHAGMKKNAQK